MCLAKAYLQNGDEPELFLVENVAALEAADGQVILTTLLGERKCVEAAIESVDFMKNRVVLRGQA